MGCGMTLICWSIFRKIGLDERIIKEHIFSWLVFASMSLYRILPLLATLAEGHSIGYNFTVPYSTYFGETLLYIVSSLAFFLVIKKKQVLPRLKRQWAKWGLYEQANERTVWVLGVFGLFIKFYMMFVGAEIGDVVGKTLSGFVFFQYAPIILFFPSLYKANKLNSAIVVRNSWALYYLIFLIILAFAGNSRYALLEPFGTFILLFLLSYIQHTSEPHKSVNRKYIVYGILGVVLVVPFVSDVSLAMLANRNLRTELSKTQLFVATVDTYLDDEKMENLRRVKESEILNYSEESVEDWSEKYVRNFALNRYCNMKVTDNTLYNAQKVGYGNQIMYEDFFTEIWALLPTPILSALGIQYDKNERYSRGDKLKALAQKSSYFGGLLVTSHLADGLVTFGYAYFIIQFVLFYIQFLLTETFVYKKDGKIFYSLYAVITIFTFLAMFRNAGGCLGEVGYMLRGYWQSVILYLIGFKLLSVSYK